MNRCIQCYRCVRFYQEFAGGTDFGVMGSAARVYFGRFSDGALESPFSGNLVDICPTGVFTDKTARFRARYWDYDMAPSICPECSLGCNTIPVARYRELLKVMARRNDPVNGWFICDRGRFADKLVNDRLRPRSVLVNGDESTWSKALDCASYKGCRISAGEHCPGRLCPPPPGRSGAAAAAGNGAACRLPLLFSSGKRGCCRSQDRCPPERGKLRVAAGCGRCRLHRHL